MSEAVGAKRVFNLLTATHSSTVVNSAIKAIVRKGNTKSVDPGPAGSPGMAVEVVTDRSIEIELVGMDPSELNGRVEAAAGNLALTYKNELGATATATYKNVQFNDPPGELSLEAKDAGGKAGQQSIKGKAQWGLSDTWATMEVFS